MQAILLEDFREPMTLKQALALTFHLQGHTMLVYNGSEEFDLISFYYENEIADDEMFTVSALDMYPYQPLPGILIASVALGGDQLFAMSAEALMVVEPFRIQERDSEDRMLSKCFIADASQIMFDMTR